VDKNIVLFGKNTINVFVELVYSENFPVKLEESGKKSEFSLEKKRIKKIIIC